MVKDPGEKELIRAVRKGKAAAQRRFYERYAQTEAEAQDWLQDGFLRIFRDLGQFRGEGSLEGWLRQVIVRTALGHLQNRPIYEHRFEYDFQLEMIYDYLQSK